MDLVNSSSGEVGSTDVETHGKSLDDDGSDFQNLTRGPYRKGERVFKPSFDIEVGTLPGCSHAGDVVGLEVVRGQTQLIEEIQAEGVLQAISTVDEPISHGATDADW